MDNKLGVSSHNIGHIKERIVPLGIEGAQEWLFTLMRAWLKNSARNLEVKTLVNDNDGAGKPLKVDATPGSAAAHQIEVERLSLANKRLEAQLKIAVDELTYAKKELKKIENDYKAKVANTLKLDIQDVLGCSDVEAAKLTHGMKVKELESMLSHVMLARTEKPTEKEGKFKPIRTDVEPKEYGEPANLTVGNLFGKKAEDIRKMGGEF